MNGLRVARRLGRHAGDRPGPTLLVVGGMHGNEPAGVVAAQRVLAGLAKNGAAVTGTLVAVAGNVTALAADRRFMVRDLNRSWQAEDVARVRGQPPAQDDAEQAEMRGLIQVIDEEAAQTDNLVVLDLHTTSGDSPPFTLMSDTRRNRRIARALPVPVILGLEEMVDGTLLEYATELGHTVVTVESGKHTDPESIELHEAVIWITMAAVGLLPPRTDEVVRAYARLRRVCREYPRVVEVRHRHEVTPGDGFAMRPGFRGLQNVRKGEPLAEDRAGVIQAPRSGRILMPLYQDQGADGFFIVTPVSRFWMGFSALLRSLRLEWVMPLLPGVERHPERPEALRVDPMVARVAVVQVFHLFGYRKRRREGRYFVFTRRTPG